MHMMQGEREFDTEQRKKICSTKEKDLILTMNQVYFSHRKITAELENDMPLFATSHGVKPSTWTFRCTLLLCFPWDWE